MRELLFTVYWKLYTFSCILRGGHKYGKHMSELFGEPFDNETEWCSRCGKNR